eukprot:SM000063S20019  [mRNA]  locus=s63:349600:351629:+ [translate_table: standard]
MATRPAQALLWRLNHPPDCAAPGLKFAIAAFPKVYRKGTGCQLHIMSMLMALAAASHRVLVLAPRTFARADHPGCAGARASLACYFRPPSPPACEARALELFAAQGNASALEPGEDVWRVELSNLPLDFRVGPKKAFLRPDVCPGLFCFNVTEAQLSLTDEYGGRLRNHKLDWFRAQSMRYLLRYPTEYLCHVENRARHASYGHWMARNALRWDAKLQELKAQDGTDPTDFVHTSAATGQLEQKLWPADAVVAPRPYISMHVREGAKGREMTLYPLRVYMEQAERVRRYDPSVHRIWIATMLTSVLDKAHEMYAADWSFYFTKQRRLQGDEEGGDFDDIPPSLELTPEQAVEEAKWALKTSVDMSFVNLLVQSQADYFIGTLGSNWDRLIDEMRKTNGRLRRGYISLNYAQT